MNLKKLILIPLLFLASYFRAFADGTKDDVEVQYRYQFGADLQFKLIKNLKLNVEPELRFNDGYDKFHLNGGLTYKTFGCIYWGATYRLVVDRVESSSSFYSNSLSLFGGFNSNNYESDVYHRYAFDATFKEKYGRFTPSFRVRYNNFTDEDISSKEFLRYKAKVDYDIRKCKITPFVSAEAFQQLGINMLYKMRYSTGFDLKTGKDSSLSFDYRFDFFNLEYKNANIFSVGYKHKF
ncbi:MAG: DUF2490 domain-containing protein [Rikenellaceae bacterium]